MAKAIVLTNITDGSTITVDGQAVYTLSSADVATKKVTVAGVGTFDFSTAAQTTFTADAALAGEITLTTTGATVTAADFSKTAGGVKFEATGGQTVTFGTGADTLVQTSGDVVVNGYNYYEGDVIKATGDVVLNSKGELTVATTSVKASNVAVKDNWYAAKVDGASVVDYFTAVSGSNQNVTKDLSDSAIANVIDAQGAKTANITLGKVNDTVSLATAGTGVDTIKVGKASGDNTIENFGAEDVVAIDGIKLVTLGLDTVAASTIKTSYGATTLTLGGLASTQGSFNLNDGSQTHKLAYAFKANETLKYATYSDADWAMGAADGTTTLEVGATTHLHDMSKYRNITKISVSADAKLDAPISLTGAIGVNNTIDASAAKVGTAVWGFSSGNDSIALGSGQDTVWFGAGDGSDTITGFKYGTASDSDVLYLKDTKTLKDVNVAYDGSANKAKFTVGSAVATVNKNANSSDVAQIKLADEKIYKVAGAYTAANTVTINTDEIEGLNFYAFNAKSDQTVSITGGKDWLVNSLYTDAYTTGATIKTIDASAATGNVTLAAAADIKGGSGINNIWTYQSDTTAAASVTAGAGTDIIWFANDIDAKVSVTGFDEKVDSVRFATAYSLKEIAEGYKFEAGAANTEIKGTNTDSVLTLYGKKDSIINLIDGNDKAYKALVMKTESAGTTGEFSTDVNIYAGMTTLTAGGAIDGTVSLRLGKESRGLSSDTYYIDDAVTKFDGSKSTATFWIAGNANKGNEIIGGLTENYLYGGGASSDVLHGSIVAKDTFYFGTGDGVDEVKSGLDTKDTIALWNIADADIANVKVTMDTDGTANIHLADSSTLKLTDTNAVSALKNGLTFTSASQTAYTYDSESKTLVKKA